MNTRGTMAGKRSAKIGKRSAKRIPSLDCSLVLDLGKSLDCSLDQTLAVPPMVVTVDDIRRHETIGKKALRDLLAISRMRSFQADNAHCAAIKTARKSNDKAALTLARLDQRFDSDIPWQRFINKINRLAR